MPNPNWLDALIGDINKLRTPLAMLKGEHTFIFNWHENAIRSLGDAMISQAENPDTVFDFDDAERMAEQAEYLLHEGL